MNTAPRGSDAGLILRELFDLIRLNQPERSGWRLHPRMQARGKGRQSLVSASAVERPERESCFGKICMRLLSYLEVAALYEANNRAVLCVGVVPKQGGKPIGVG